MFLYCVYATLSPYNNTIDAVSELQYEPGCSYCGGSLKHVEAAKYSVYECRVCTELHAIGWCRSANKGHGSIIKMYVFIDEFNEDLPEPFDKYKVTDGFILHTLDGSTWDPVKHVWTNEKDKFAFGRQVMTISPEEFVFHDFPLENI